MILVAHSCRAKTLSQLPLFAVVLAAGAARRFGSSKQLATLNGQSLVQRTLNTVEAVFAENVVLVVGDTWQAVHRECSPLAGYLVRNDDPSSGMASSLAAGTRAVDGAASGLMLLLADQPLIDRAHLERLIAAWDRSAERIVCSQHDAINGPPAIFPRKYFAELKGLEGDRGARALLDRYTDDVVALPCPAAIDIDTPDDLRRAERALNKTSEEN